MLVLSRKIGERVVVPELDLAVTVVAIEGNKVRLGFSAPADVEVYREEIWSEIEEEEDLGIRPIRPGRAGRPVPTKSADTHRNPFLLSVFHGRETSHD